MASVATIPPRIKRAVPNQSPLEAPTIVCGACGRLLQPQVKMAANQTDYIYYECKNEESGCNWYMTRRVFVQYAAEMKGRRPDGSDAKIPQ